MPSLEQEYTGFKDAYGNRIYLASLLRNTQGNFYMVKADAELGYVLFDLFNRTVEKLGQQLCYALLLVPDDKEIVYL